MLLETQLGEFFIKNILTANILLIMYTRGGKDQFKWDDVKQDKHRENYLGHSVMAPVGRWQNGRDLNWYSRSEKHGSTVVVQKDELSKIREAEEQAMMSALYV